MAGGRLSGARATAAVVALIAVALAGCGSSGGGAGPGGSSNSPPSTAAAITPSSSPPASGGGTPADAATAKAITAAFGTLFGHTATTPQDVAVLQHGPVFRKTIDEQGKSSYADTSSAKVTRVLVHGNVADVTFSILDKGKPLLQGFHGNAVREGGHWKVAAKTFCSLLQLEGDAPSACSNASITALPD